MARSLNKVQLIGNLTRDPEMKYTPSGTAVCTFGLATNRQWVTESGEKKEDAEFHRLVAWNKLAEICSQLLTKGRKVYVEGRLQTRNWQGQDGAQRYSTEIVVSDMIILDNRRDGFASVDDFDIPDVALDTSIDAPHPAETAEKKETASVKKDDKKVKVTQKEEEEIPF